MHRLARVLPYLIAVLMVVAVVAPQSAIGQEAPGQLIVTEPVDLGGGLSVTSAFFAYPVSTLGTYLYVDVVNGSGAAIAAPEVTVEVFDGGGVLFKRHKLTPELTWAPDGGHLPYTDRAALPEGASIPDIGRVSFTATPNTTFTAADLDVSLLAIDGFRVSEAAQTGSGTLVNHDRVPWAALTVVVAAYDATGVYVGSCDQRVEKTLSAGDSMPIRMSIQCSLMESGMHWREASGPFSYQAFVTRGKLG